MQSSKLVKTISEKYNARYYNEQLDLVDIEKAFKLVKNAICDALVANKRIEIRNFGTFSNHIRTETWVRNPKNGNKILKNKSFWPHFKAGKILKQRIDICQKE